MDEVRADEVISFQEIEATVWESLVASFRAIMGEVLTGLGQALHDARDPERYVYKEMRAREELTRVGPISFRRHYYWDREENRWVFLLDEALGLVKRQRVSEGVRADAVEAAVAGSSYRGAAAELERRGSGSTVSHEAIRQWTLRAGKAIEAEMKRQQERPAGNRRVPVVFVEADGFWPGRQRGKREEVRLFVAHEGWSPRTPGSQEYRLVNRREYVAGPKGDVWAEFSAWLESEYDLSETWVVINGDRAAWIRRGVEWFPKAMYQVDRFHLKRDVQRLLRGHPADLAKAQAAIAASDAQGLLQALEGALRDEDDPKRRRDLRALRADLGTIPESTRDYRVRLAERGECVEGLRGIGSAESAVERYSRRTRKVGRGWSTTGLQAMLHVMTAYFRGTLHGVVQSVESMMGLEPLTKAREAARQTAVETVGRGLDAARHGRLPALHGGSTGTGGLSKLFRSIVNG
jgi:hypothetical protein